MSMMGNMMLWFEGSDGSRWEGGLGVILMGDGFPKHGELNRVIVSANLLFLLLLAPNTRLAIRNKD